LKAYDVQDFYVLYMNENWGMFFFRFGIGSEWVPAGNSAFSSLLFLWLLHFWGLLLYTSSAFVVILFFLSFYLAFIIGLF